MLLLSNIISYLYSKHKKNNNVEIRVHFKFIHRILYSQITKPQLNLQKRLLCECSVQVNV